MTTEAFKKSSELDSVDLKKPYVMVSASNAAAKPEELDIHPKIYDYFTSRQWEFFDFQKQSIAAYSRGESGLIHSPTGSGKTLAAWLGPINEFLHETGKDIAKPPRIRVLWVTPLRALASDTENSLKDTVNTLGLGWSVGRRTGDTSTSERNKQRKRLPTCLITTPESLSLLISYPDTAAQLKNVKAVVVDEWHELLGTKRGVQLELCLAYLRTRQNTLRTWGLSATIGNVEQALQVLLGRRKHGLQHTLISADIDKKISIRSIIPDNVERFPWSGHMGTRLLPKVIAQIEKAKSTLIFTNTRSQAEIWFENILRKKPEWLEHVGLHHGSLAKKVRDHVELGLREGRLKAAVCTSSLDLGVDFSPVEQVIQIGSPKGVARLLQRAGRSGHNPGRVSEVICVPTHAFELLEIAAARRAAESANIESRKPLTLCLDVLVQHCVSLTLGGQLFEGKTFKEIKSTHCFSKLSPSQWQWVLDFITRGGDALQHYDDYKRVVRKGRNFKIANARIARLHRMSVGTITSDSSMRVKFLKGDSIGNIEESFISKLKHKDAFLFNGRLLSLVQVKDMTAYVRLADKKNRIVPRWQGGRLPLSTELADKVRALLHPEQSDLNVPEISSIEELLKLQKNWSRLPYAHQLLVEKVKTREGFHIFIYPFAGRLANEGIAALLAYRLTQLEPITFTTSANDYGFELLSRTGMDFDDAVLRQVLREEGLLSDILASINASEMARRQFRDIARISGLIIQGHPGNRKSTRQVQASSSLIYDVLKNYDADNLLLDQSIQEVLETQIEYSRLNDALAVMRAQESLMIHTEKLSPLAFPLWAERLRGQIISSEKWQERVLRMLDSLERKADKVSGNTAQK